jgi:O-antigen ligase
MPRCPTAMSKAAFYSLWCFILVLPWQVFTKLPVVGSIPRIVGLVATGAGVLYILVRRRVRPLTWFHAFALLFVLWTGVTSFWSIDPDGTHRMFLTYLQLVVFVWLMWEIAWTPARQRALLQAYVVGVSLASLLAIQNYLSGIPIAGEHLGVEAVRFTALDLDVNELGLTLALGLPMAWYLSLSPTHRRAWLWRLYLPLGLTGILLTASRGSILAAVVGLAIIPWTLGRLRLRTKAALYVLAAGSLLLVSTVVPQAALVRIASTGADIESGYFGGRGTIWAAGVEVAREHPLVGVGTGAFEAAVEPALNAPWAAHNVFLSILVEDGLVGLFLFVAMIVTALAPLPTLSREQRRFSIVLLLALMVGSMSLSWGDRKQFWFVLGVLAVQGAPRRSRDHRFTTSPLVTVPERP